MATPITPAVRSSRFEIPRTSIQEDDVENGRRHFLGIILGDVHQTKIDLTKNYINNIVEACIFI